MSNRTKLDEFIVSPTAYSTLLWKDDVSDIVKLISSLLDMDRYKSCLRTKSMALLELEGYNDPKFKAIKLALVKFQAKGWKMEITDGLINGCVVIKVEL